MNAILSTTTPLPVFLDQPAIAGLGRRQVPLGRDQLATAARQPCDNSQIAVEPPSIGERMGRLETAAMMVDVPDWTSTCEAADGARLVNDYALGGGGLTPDWLARDWERTCDEAHALAAHQRAVREHSYLPQPAAMFRIH